MKIDNIDLLKKWLVNVLNPMFDGDPEKLALYIVALAKKVEDDQASRDRCINDLEVFLEANTSSFVESLFDALSTNKYLTASVATPPPPVEPAVPQSRPNNPQPVSDQFASSSSSSNKYQSDREQRSRRFTNYDESNNSNNNNTRRYDNRGGFNKARLSRDYQEIDAAGNATAKVKTNRSRSRSNKARHKNRSRNRTHRGADSSSSSSSSSPDITSRRFDGERKSAYRRSYSRSRSYSPKNENKKQRCRDFDEKGMCLMAEFCPYDHGEVVLAPVLNAQKQDGDLKPADPALMNNYSVPPPALLPQPGTYTPSNSNELYQHSRQQQQQQRGHNMKHPRSRNQNINQANNNNNNNKPPLLPMPPHALSQPQSRFINQPNNNTSNNDANFNAQQRQIITTNRPRNLVNIVTSIQDEDQNEQTYQQRGVKRTYNNTNFGPNSGFMNENQMINNDNNYSFNNNPSGYNQQLPPLLPTPPMVPNQFQHNQQAFNKNANFNNPSLATQAASTVNTAQAAAGAASMNENAAAPPLNTPAATVTSSTSANNNGLANQGNINNTTLILRKVPNDLNRPENMRQHFSKFGQLLDIQCHYENQNDAVLVKFATNQQAFAAFRSPQPVFNNRFIRIYWLSNYQKHQQFQQESGAAAGHDEPQLKRHLKERLAYGNQAEQQSQQDLAKNKENNQVATFAEPSGVKEAVNASIGTSEVNPEGVEAPPGLSNNFNSLTLKQNVDKSKAYESIAAAKAINDENQKKVNMLKMQVKQKARELIEQQIKDQKLLLQKFEHAKTVEEKSLILNLVRKLNESIEKEKEILNNKNFSTDEQPTSGDNFSPFSFQKVLKQAAMSIPPPAHHLKLNNKRLNNTNFLKNHTTIVAHNHQYAGKQSASGAMKPMEAAALAPFNYSKAVVDNRPKSLTISGIENPQEHATIMSFFKVLGCHVESATEIQLNEATNLFSFSINFSTRKDAEIALTYRNRNPSLMAKTISMTWSKSEVPALIEADKTQVKEALTQVSTDSTSQSSVSEEDAAKPKGDEDETKCDQKEEDKSVQEPTDADEENLADKQSDAAQKEFVDALFDDSTENILS